MTPPHSLRGSGAALFALVALVWAPTLANGFVWDDLANLVRSARLGEWSALYEVFAHDAMWSRTCTRSSPWTTPCASASTE